MEPDKTQLRFTYAAQNVLGKDVMAMRRDEWNGLLLSNGMPTLLNQAPAPVAGVMSDSMVVAVAASGICNPDPGFDIVRYDPKDAPHIYNIDHYRVHENLTQHERFSEICKAASVVRTPQLENTLTEFVFVVKNKPSETADHWSTELPERINISRHTTD